MKTIDLVTTTDAIIMYPAIMGRTEVHRFKERVYLSVRLQRMFGIPTLLRDDVKYSQVIERYGKQIDALNE